MSARPTNIGARPFRAHGGASLQRAVRIGHRRGPVFPVVSMVLMILSNVASAQSPAFQPTYEDGTARRGQDYRSFNPMAPSALYCQQACLSEEQCRAWSYEPPRGDKQPMCWLKSGVPAPAPAQGIVSGVVRPDGNYAAAAPTGTPAQRGSVKAVFENYNLLGDFAQDCGKPASNQNFHYLNTILDPDHVQRERVSGANASDFVNVIEKVSGLGPNEISVSGTRTEGRFKGQPFDEVWRVEPNRYMVVEAKVGDTTLISGGRITNGPNAWWINKCAPAPTASSGAPPAGPDGVVKALFEKYDLLGSFAQDCGKPASAQNLHYIITALDSRRVQRERQSGTNSPDFVNVIEKVSELGPNQISVSGTRTEGRFKGQAFDEVWRVEPNRYMVVEAKVGDTTLVSGGRITNGPNTWWINKCAPAPAGAVTANSAGPPPAADGAVKALFEKHNLLGVWSPDCRKPAKEIENWYYVNRLVDANHVRRERMASPTTVNQVTILDQAWELGASEVAVAGTRDGQPVKDVWRMENGRMVMVSATFGDKQLIADGKWWRNGMVMPLLNRCD